MSGTLLAFDFGTKSIGVAVGQRITGTARPLTALKANDGTPDWNLIERLLREWQPDDVIVGLPLNMDGTEQPLTARSRKFANKIHGRFGVSVKLHDERLSTVEARAGLFEHGVSAHSTKAASIRLLPSLSSKAISNRVTERRGLQPPLRPSLCQALVKVLHPRLLTGLNNPGQLPRFTFADKVRCRWRIHQQLIQRDAPTLQVGKQSLRQHRSQAAGQLITHRVFLLRRERIDQPFNRLRGTARVQRRQHQMPGFSGRQGQADRFAVAQFSQQDDIRIFTQRSAQRLGK